MGYIVGAPSQGFLSEFSFSATAGQTTFQGFSRELVFLSYSPGYERVFLNGHKLTRGLDYQATNGSSIVLVSAAALGDELVVEALSVFDVANALTQAQADAAYRRDGECRLVWDSATQICLYPWGGNRLVIDGVPREIPGGGVVKSNAGLTANTTYYVYAYWTGTAIALELSTTAYVRSSVGSDWYLGLCVKSGDSTRRLVGLVRANNSTQFVDANDARFVLSFFNRRRKRTWLYLSGDQSTTSTSYTAMNGTTTYFLTWGDAPVQLYLNGSVDNSDNGSASSTLNVIGGIDGTYNTAHGFHYVFASQLGNHFTAVAWNIPVDIAEGYHYYGIGLAVATSGHTGALKQYTNVGVMVEG